MISKMNWGSNLLGRGVIVIHLECENFSNDLCKRADFGCLGWSFNSRSNVNVLEKEEVI